MKILVCLNGPENKGHSCLSTLGLKVFLRSNDIVVNELKQGDEIIDKYVDILSEKPELLPQIELILKTEKKIYVKCWYEELNIMLTPGFRVVDNPCDGLTIGAILSKIPGAKVDFLYRSS
jgi:hypothetical protein